MKWRHIRLAFGSLTQWYGGLLSLFDVKNTTIAKPQLTRKNAIVHVYVRKPVNTKLKF